MGQYWHPVNLDKKEFINPSDLGSGLKLWEQLAAHPGTGAALVVLTAAMPEARGGGDFDLNENWHGTARHEAMKAGEIDGCTPGPMPDDYSEIAARTIGRWAGDRIVIVGDYSKDKDMPDSPIPFGSIYGLCADNKYREKYPEDYPEKDKDGNTIEYFNDITADVCAVIEHELNGKYQGDGWKDFVYDNPERNG